MPTILSDDGTVAQVQMDDGSIVPVASKLAPNALSSIQPDLYTGAPKAASSDPLAYMQGIQSMGNQYSGPPTKAETAVQMAGMPYTPRAINWAENAIDSGNLPPAVEEKMKYGSEPLKTDEQSKPDANVLKSATDAITSFKSQTPYDLAGEKIKTGIAKEYNAQAALQKDAAKSLAERNKVLDQLDQQEAQKREAFVQTMQAKSQAVDSAIEDARNSPIEGWANASTGTKVMAGIAIALGGFGQAFGGGENQGLKVINQAIDRDIELQKARAAQKQQYASNMLNSYQRMRELGADDLQATLAMKANALERAKMNIEQMTANSMNQQLLGKRDQLIGAIDTQIEDHKQQAMKLAQEQFDKNYKPERFVPGLGYAQYGTEGDVSKAREAYSDAQAVVSGIDRLMDLSKSNEGKKLPWSKVKAEVQQIREPLKYQLKKIFADSAGRISPADEKMIEVADPTDFISVNDELKLNTLKRRVLEKVAPQLQGVGLKFAVPKQVTNEAGTFEEVAPGQYKKVF